MNEIESSAVENSSEPLIHLFFTPAAVNPERVKGYRVVVIDVLRAATSIALALSNGAKNVIPAESVSAAIDISTDLNRDDILLCGERDSKLVEGFHLGNSPAEYTRERVRGRTIIFGSTNGSPAIVRASTAKSLLLVGFINLNAAIDAILELTDPFPLAIVCAGKYDSFAIEDAVCGGLLIKRLKVKLADTARFNDAAKAAQLLYDEFGGDLLSLLRECDHGRYLIDIGMESDLPICASDSVLPIVPTLVDGTLINPQK